MSSVYCPAFNPNDCMSWPDCLPTLLSLSSRLMALPWRGADGEWSTLHTNFAWKLAMMGVDDVRVVRLMAGILVRGWGWG
jgi:hypothetical protein